MSETELYMNIWYGLDSKGLGLSVVSLAEDLN